MSICRFGLKLLFYSDPAYAIVNKIATSLGFGLWLPNLVCCTIAIIGIVAFSLKLPNPWMAIAVAAPYVIIVLIVNYTRQAAAFGFELLALVALYSGNLKKFYIWVFMAVAFHKTALFIIIFGLFYPSQRPALKYIILFIVSLILFYLFLAKESFALIANYFGTEMHSGGAFIRVLMNATAGVGFLLFYKYFNLSFQLKRFWLRISLLSLLFIVLLEFITLFNSC